ncbi:MAG: YicC family protein [Peptococcaceae bacterium]
MLKSMTGFGQGEACAEGRKVKVEIKTVNHRFCEIGLRLPKNLNFLEERIRRKVAEYVRRGRVDIFINGEDLKKKNVTVKVDKDLAATYYNAVKELQAELEIPGKIKLMSLVSFPGVLEVEVTEESETYELWWPVAEKALEQALINLSLMREKEGQQLKKDLSGHLMNIEKLSQKIEQRAPLVAEEHHKRLKGVLAKWLNDGLLDIERVYAEVALFAERANISEEVTRLSSHLKQTHSCLETNDPVGRKIEFLVQEMNREINTIAAKANSSEISRLVIEVKSDLEKIREQAQNIE